MTGAIRILLLEDSAADAELLERELRKTLPTFSLQRADTEEAFVQSLKESPPDIILADNSLPGFSGTEALRLTRQAHAELPFISISGDSDGIEGATDIVSKRNLPKLGPVVQRALQEWENRKCRREAEAALRDSELRFRAIFEGAGAGIAVEDLDGRIIESNRALQQMLGYTAEELQALTRRDLSHGHDQREEQTEFHRLLAGESDYCQVEKRFVRKDGRLIWGRLTVSIARDAAGKARFPLAMIEDITERQRAEEAHLQHAAIVEFSNDAIISTTFDGIIFSWNPAAERLYGYTAQEANGRADSLVIPPDKEAETEQILARIKSGERIDNFETRRARKDGSLLDVSITVSPIQDALGKIIGVSSISRDITGRKLAEAALRESEENYRKLVELAPDGIFILTEGTFVYLNAAGAGIMGARDTSELLGKKMMEFVHPDSRETVEENVTQLKAGKNVALHEKRLLRLDGTAVDVEALALPFIYRGQQAVQIIVRNISERKRAEEALRRSEAGLIRAQRIAHLGSWEHDLRTDTLTWSDETYRIFGVNRAQQHASNELFFSCVHPEDRAMVRRAIEDTLTNGVPYNLDHRIVLPHGEVKTVNEQAEVILNELGQPIRMLGTVLDITERKRAENLSSAFAKLGQRLSSASTADDAARIIVDVADRLLGWDACSVDLCSPDRKIITSILGMDLINGERTDVSKTYINEAPSAGLRRVLEHGARLILRQIPFEGKTDFTSFGDTSRPSVSLMFVPVRNGARVIGVLSIQSYSPNAYTQADLETLQALGDHCGSAFERIRAEAENQKLAAFPQFNPNPVLELGPDGKINYFNEASQQMAQSLGKKHFAEFLPPETPQIVKECLATGESKLRMQSIINDRTISWSFFPVQSIGVVHCYAGDITDRQNLEAQLRHSQKMESVGQLAGGIAHDFNNILTVIQGHTSLLGMIEKLPEEARDSAQQIGVAADRAANLTRQLLTFSRRQIIQPKNLDLNEAVNNMTKMLRRLLGEDITLQVSYTPGLPLVHADPGMMEQILLNLAINARDAMPKGGSLFVNTSLIIVTQLDAQQFPEANPGEYVSLTVKDTGTGIPPEVLPHIFEPFFTTKDVGKGTGLGLATVYGIVQQHQGWIKAASIVGKETIFQLGLPALKTGPSAASELVLEAKVRGGKETILVVEDEQPLRHLVRSVLERYGYRVLEAVSGLAALAVWERHKKDIDLVLTDMVMPHGISGRELAQRLLNERPELKVIYSSGYSLAVVGSDMMLREGLNFLQKPYHPAKLASAVRECLDREK